MFVFFLVVSMLCPVMMTVICAIWKNHPPKEVNPLAGYRTQMSMKNRYTWKYAHLHFCRISLWIDIPLAVLSPAVVILFRGSGDDTLGNVIVILMLVQVVGTCLPIIPTERALRRYFDENGNPRS